MLTPYRRILTLPGTAAFTSAGFLARLPMAMTGLGIVLLVSDRTGSYGIAGAVSAAYVAGAALGEPMLGRLVDRHGQARVVPPALAGFTLATVLLVVGVEAGWARPSWFLGALLAGASFPPWGSLVRARWVYALTERRTQLPTAFALEAVVDEAVFVIGPALVTVLVTLVHPVSGISVAAVLGVVGGLLLVAQPATAPPPSPARASADQPMGWRTLGALALATVGLGAFFGGAEIATVAFAEEAGRRADAGWMLAVWAVGSLLAGVVAGTLPAGDPLRRFRWGAVLLTLTMATTTTAGGVVVLALLLFCSGAAISPTLIAAVALVEQSVPRGRLTEGMGWLTTGLLVGVAPGAALTGATVDAYGASAAFWVPVGGGLLAAALGWTIRPSSARLTATTEGEAQTVAESSARVRADTRRRRDA